MTHSGMAWQGAIKVGLCARGDYDSESLDFDHLKGIGKMSRAKIRDLKHEVCEANKELQRQHLCPLTWGNVSGLDADRGLVVIKPSGVPYEALTPDTLVVVDMDGRVVEGDLNPSSDISTHLYLYAHFKGVCGVTHTHSAYATMFAQAMRELPCLGTSHADHFSGSVPVTRCLTPQEIEDDYTRNTGRVIVECFAHRDYLAVPAVFAAHHAPFTWGRSPRESLDHATALEMAAQMALGTYMLNPGIGA
ncbi:MAG: L-ribulose-5-phosphate 4-epimerase AraD, partial [Verrucomicrobia bacterium]|nr:L-ribulose-5-phosphate 4-epimerase AraD [Verrucomicrobiota bacterium]